MVALKPSCVTVLSGVAPPSRLNFLISMGEEEVKLMSDENVRVLVQRPTVVKKMLAKKAEAK